MYKDETGNLNFDIPEKYKSNCHGWSMDLDLWIFDPNDAAAGPNDTVHEDIPFRNMMNSNYQSNASDATIISFYSGNQLTHSIRRDPDTGEIWSKTNNAAVEHYENLDDFYNAYRNREIYGDLEQKFYNPY